MRQVVSRALVIVAALASVIAVFIAQSPFAQASAGLKKIHDPRRVTYSIRLKSCHARDGSYRHRAGDRADHLSAGNPEGDRHLPGHPVRIG